jgi:hypothetical protein
LSRVTGGDVEFEQVLIAARFFDGMQADALEVLDGVDLAGFRIRQLAHDAGHVELLVDDAGGGPAAFACHDLVIFCAVWFAHDEGLDDALDADALGEFAEGFAVEPAAGVAVNGVAVERGGFEFGMFEAGDGVVFLHDDVRS